MNMGYHINIENDHIVVLTEYEKDGRICTNSYKKLLININNIEGKNNFLKSNTLINKHRHMFICGDILLRQVCLIFYR